MYLEFYGLSEKPFSQTPDPRFLYWNDAYRETLASLSYGIGERKGFIAMIGEAGTGKTTLLRKLLDDLGDDIVSVFLFNPNATFEEILEYTLSELGIATPSGRKLAMLQRLNEFLLAAYGEGRNTILLIDEAQDLDNEVLESLRLLSNLETSDDKILQIVLSGQPELAQTLSDPGLRQLKQRIAVRCRLEPLQEEELASYLGARLDVAGGSADLFDPETLPAIWDFTAGIPRMINTLCDNALLLGYALGRRTIDVEVIEEVIADLRKLDADAWMPTRAPVSAPARTEEPPVAAPVEQAPPPEAPQARYAPERAAPHEPMQARPAPSWPAGPSNPASLVVTAVVAGLVLLLAGAWLGRVAIDTPAPAAEEPSAAVRAPAPPADAGLSAASVATAATREPTSAPREDAPTAAVTGIKPAPPRVDEVSAPQPAAPKQSMPEPAARKADVAVAAPDPAPIEPRGQAFTPPPAAIEPLADAKEASERAPRPESQVPLAPETGMRAAPEPIPPPSAVAPAQASAPGDGKSGVGPASPPPADTRLALAAPTARASDAAPPGRPNVSVAPGDTLGTLAARRYGSANQTTLDMLMSVNPDIRDVNLIIAGQGLVFPDPGPSSRILPDGSGFAVLALTTQTLSRALALQSSLEDQLDRPVSLERVSTRAGPSLFRVSVRGLGAQADAADIATGLGSILQDPSP